MTKSLLLTSFDVWKSHHTSNASDDLLEELLTKKWLQQPVHLLRKLPVDFELAPAKVIATMQTVQPDVVVCCGMAEKRSRLSVESNGKVAGEKIYTSVDVRTLTQDLAFTRVSHNAGKFVCNHTYYSILKYIRDSKLKTDCTFVHVPVLTQENREQIAIDFAQILSRLNLLS
ncbi:MAG: peptidase C15 [Leptolyngbyaceae cyanobacterium bins.349]|nr:peptidase C15 [Leptolyngbyaceae cyanobacterium bins.349]